MRRTRLLDAQATLWPDWRYHAFVTDRDGNAVELDVDHRRHAVVELAIRDLKAGSGLRHCPSGRFLANAAWVVVATLAHNLLRWVATLGLGQHGLVVAKTLRARLLALPGRLTRSARQQTLHLPAGWPWAAELTAAVTRLRAVPACWELGAHPSPARLRLRKWAHMLGFGGHISTKSRRYSTTLTALRRARAAFAARRGRRQVAELAGSSRRETVEAEAVMVLARWRYLGSGYQTEGEAWLARSAAADAREQRRVASRAGDGMTAEERTRIQEAGRRYVREQAPRPPVAVLERVARIVLQAMGTIRSATVPDVTGVDAGRPEAA